VHYLWTFAVMFVTAMTISHLAIRLRAEAEAARQGEERSAWLMEKAKKAEIDAEAERLRSSLLSSVSHDFRTPLTAIVGSAGALLEKRELAKNPKTASFLEISKPRGTAFPPGAESAGDDTPGIWWSAVAKGNVSFLRKCRKCF